MTIRRLRWVAGLGVLLLAVLSLGAATGRLPVAWGAPGAQDSNPPPRVFDTVPLPGEELALDGPVTFSFDQPMDPTSAAGAFSVAPQVAGDLSWPDNSTLTFTPSAKYDRAAEYVFTIGTGATSAQGVAMAEAYTLKLRTIGYLEVSQVLPAPDTDAVDTDSVVTVIFNRPVVPLLTAEEMNTLPQPITFDPQVDGKGEWMNTSIYLFTPSQELRGGTKYTVTVKAGLQDVTGSLLKDDYNWSFTTLRPDISSISPEDQSDGIGLDATVTVAFTQAMDPNAVASAFTLKLLGPTGGDQYLPQPVTVTGKSTWSDDRRTLTFTPDQRLELGSAYRIDVVGEKALSATGAPLLQDASSQFYTVPYPAILYTSPSDGETEANPYGGLTIYFAGAMDLKTLKDKVIIDPKPWRDFDTYFYDWDNSYTLSFDTEPSTEYTITILPGMADLYGNTIKTGMVVTYSTAAYPPELTIQSPGTVGMYSSYSTNTRVFVTHRNVSRLDMSLWSISLSRFAQMVGPNSYDAWHNFTPRPNDLLRKWSMSVSSEQDVRRYELLLISDKGPSGISNIECLGAPDTQVKIGDVVIVTRADMRPLNIRQEPNLTATSVTQVLPDEKMQVIDGPRCEGGYYWWQVQLTNGITGWAAEGDKANYYFEPLGETPTDPNAPASASTANQAYQPQPLAPGIYYLTVDSPEMAGWDDYGRRHLMLVQSANLTLKFSPDTALAWVTDMQSGQPVPDVPVIFYDTDFNPVAQARTGADGLAEATIPHLESLYTDMYASVDSNGMFGFAVSEWSDGMDPWQFDISSDYEPENFTVYMYTDRPIYRPDQPVYFKGILRDRHDVSYTAPANITQVPVKVYDDQGQVIYDKVLPVSPTGSFTGEIKLDTNAPLGYYRIVAEVGSNQRDSFDVSFNVAEYRAPEFQVDVTPAADAVVQGDKIDVLVDSRYFFGGAVSNADVSYTVLSQDYSFSYNGDQPGYWSFADIDYDNFTPGYYSPQGQTVTQGDGKTDEMGRFMIEIPAQLGEKGGSQTYTIEASVTDESDQLVAGRAQVIVHEGLVYVGLQPQDYVGSAKKENKINVLVVDWDSVPVAGQEVAYHVVERRWSSVQQQDSMGRTTWTWDVQEIPIEGATGTVKTDDKGLAQISFTPPYGGVFKVYADAVDKRANKITSSAFLWVSGDNYISWRQDNSNRITLITDKDEYKVGDTAQILIPSPWQGDAYALVTVERSGVLTHEVVPLKTNSTVYKLPITADFAPNVFFSVVLVKGVDANNPVASFRMGTVKLPVDTSHFVMKLDVSSNVPEGGFAGPGDTVTYTIKATDWQGTPVPSAEIGVGLTDLSVLSIASPNSDNLLPFFYYERGISVRTSSPLTISVDQATQTIIDTIKGGGGGGGGGGIFEVRQNFVDTPLWKPDLVTDNNGVAKVDVKLPDNLTTWRLDARAVTTGQDGPMLVGQTTFDLLSTKPVLIRPGTPRFFIVGDQATMAAIVNNNTSEDLVTQVTLEGSGFQFADGVSASQRVTIPAKGRARVNWAINVLDVPQIDATFYANAGDGKYTDASKPTILQGKPLPVYKYEVPETVGTAGTLSGPEASSRTEAVVLPRRYNVTQGELTVRLDRSLAAAMTDSLTWLHNYPYYCIEQIISRFLPNAITLRSLNSLGLDDPVLKANLEVEVSYALQRLYSEQKSDGGWGWFVTDDSNPIVTAYALIGLAEAQKSGFSVDQSVIDNAANFVAQSLVTIRPQDDKWRINRQAFLLYALARAGQGKVGNTVRLFDERENMSLYAKAYLAMTFHILDPQDKRATELLNDLNNSLITSATGAHWEEDYSDWWNWNTDTRTTALGLMAMTEIDPKSQLIPNVVRWLMVARKADSWETTQETAWSVMALTEWMVVTNELRPNYTFNVSLNGTHLPISDNTATPDNVKQAEVLYIQVADLLAGQANRLIISRTAGDGNLYYTTHLRAFLPVPEVKALNRGIILSRKYSLADDPADKPITSAEVGTQVKVTLTIIAPNDLYYAVIEDPLPAGADAVNPNLLTSTQVGTEPSLNRTSPLSHGWGWWWFSNIEMRDEKVVLYATYLPRGTYEFTYYLYPGLAGAYNVIPTTGYEFYFPEVYGRTDGSLFTITGGTPSDATPAPASTQATPEATPETAPTEVPPTATPSK